MDDWLDYDITTVDCSSGNRKVFKEIIQRLYQSKSFLTKEDWDKLFLFIDERCYYRKISISRDVFLYLNEYSYIIGPELSKAIACFEEKNGKGLQGVWCRRNKYLIQVQEFLNSICVSDKKVYYPRLVEDLLRFVLDDEHELSLKSMDKLNQVGKFKFSLRQGKLYFYDDNLMKIDDKFVDILKEILERKYAPSEKDIH